MREAKDGRPKPKIANVTDRQTDGQTDGQTRSGIEKLRL